MILGLARLTTNLCTLDKRSKAIEFQQFRPKRSIISHGRTYWIANALLSPRFFKKASGILQSPPSVSPSRYLLLNHWTKSNQIWCVGCSHEWCMQRHIFFGPTPWGGAKRSNIIKFQLQSQFERFFNQTLCVFSHMKDIKHIRRDFHLAAWVMP